MAEADTPHQPFEVCPNCGRPLSAWEQVLLKVDRALMCKGCWFRITLNPFDDQPTPPPHRNGSR